MKNAHVTPITCRVNSFVNQATGNTGVTGLFRDNKLRSKNFSNKDGNVAAKMSMTQSLFTGYCDIRSTERNVAMFLSLVC